MAVVYVKQKVEILSLESITIHVLSMCACNNIKMTPLCGGPLVIYKSQGKLFSLPSLRVASSMPDS